MRTPWGESDYSKQYGPGITFYSTPSHGGLYLPPTTNAKMPEALRIAGNYGASGGGWYEEDCDWCLVAIAFPEFFSDQGAAMDTLINWHPERYEKHFGVTLGPGMSRMRDEELFYQAHANNYLVISASGDWAEGVPKGFVKVTARIGGRARNAQPDKDFFVPAAEYDQRPRFAFVVNPEVHQEVKAA